MREQTERSAETAVYRYGTMLFRICLVSLGNNADAEDAVQDTFLRYIQKAPAFESDEHEKAWLIRVAVNRCRDMIRSRRPQVDIETVAGYGHTEESGEVIAALMTLPDKFRTVLTLHYVEGYKVNEIAKMTGKTPSAIKMRLQKGRALLEQAYRSEVSKNE